MSLGISSSPSSMTFQHWKSWVLMYVVCTPSQQSNSPGRSWCGLVGEIPRVKELWLLDFDIVWKKKYLLWYQLLDRQSTCGTTNGSAEQPAKYSRVFVLCLSKMIQTNEKKTRTLVLRSIRNRSHRLVSLSLTQYKLSTQLSLSFSQVPTSHAVP